MAFISLDNVTKVYEKKRSVLVLDQVSFAVSEGEFISIMGPTKSGKTTLLGTIGGMVPPTTGRVLLAELDIYSLGSEIMADFRRDFVGYVFDIPLMLDYLTIEKNIMLPLLISHKSVSEQKYLASEVIDKFNIREIAPYFPSQLSRSEIQIASIARAYINEPHLLLIDDPTLSLDGLSSQELMSILEKINKDGTTIIYTTTDSMVASYSNRHFQIMGTKLLETSKTNGG